jgi:hypothetical protein
MLEGELDGVPVGANEGAKLGALVGCGEGAVVAAQDVDEPSGSWLIRYTSKVCPPAMQLSMFSSVPQSAPFPSQRSPYVRPQSSHLGRSWRESKLSLLPGQSVAAIAVNIRDSPQAAPQGLLGVARATKPERQLH